MLERRISSEKQCDVQAERDDEANVEQSYDQQVPSLMSGFNNQDIINGIL